MTLDPYASGVLVEEHHSRLVQNLEGYAKDAGIQSHWISTALADTCGPDEVEYVRNFISTGPKARSRASATSVRTRTPTRRRAWPRSPGALVRNFIRARVMTLGTVLDQITKGGSVDATVLLIPNFCLSKDEGGSIAAWQTQALYDLLIQRAADGLQTILYATSLADVGTIYGLAARRTIETHYLKSRFKPHDHWQEFPGGSRR